MRRNPFLEVVEGGEDAERQCELVLCVEKHRQEDIGGLEGELNGRQRPRANETAVNERQRMPTGMEGN